MAKWKFKEKTEEELQKIEDKKLKKAEDKAQQVLDQINSC